MMAIGRSLVFTGLSFLSSDRTAPGRGNTRVRGGSDGAHERNAGRRGKGSRPPPGKVVV